ncbi:MAG: hypothetical protein ABFD77_00865 [Thermotogota bacterium]
MKRALFSAATIALLLGVIASAQIKDEIWATVPVNTRIEFVARAYDGSVFAYVQALWAAPGSEVFAGEIGPKLIAAARLMFDGREALMVFVAPATTGYFWPTDLAFVQGYTQYGVGYGDYFALSGPFSGQLLSGTVSVGFVALPSALDLTKALMLYYDDKMQGPMGPFRLP